MMSGLILHVRE